MYLINWQIKEDVWAFRSVSFSVLPLQSLQHNDFWPRNIHEACYNVNIVRYI